MNHSIPDVRSFLECAPPRYESVAEEAVCPGLHLWRLTKKVYPRLSNQQPTIVVHSG
jgi:hypothetical protein